MKMNKILAAMAATAISATAFAAMSISSASAADEIAKAYFIGSVGSASNWNEGDNSDVSVTSIDGDAQYQATWDFSEATNTGTGGDWFLAVVITPDDTSSNFTTDTYPDLKVTLDEVYVDGNLITGYDASNAVNTAYYEKTPGVTRIYVNSSWADGKTLLFDNQDVESQIKVVFTVSGLGVEGTSNVTTDTEDTTEGSTDSTTTTTTAGSSDDSSTTTTTAASGDSSTTTTTAKDSSKKDSKTTTKAADGTVASASTGDLGAGAAVTALAVAGVAAFVARKKD